MQNSQQKHKFKVFYRGDKKFISAVDYDTLLKLSFDRFKAAKRETMTLFFTDCEGDPSQLDCQEDFDAMIEENEDKKDSIVLTIREKGGQGDESFPPQEPSIEMAFSTSVELVNVNPAPISDPPVHAIKNGQQQQIDVAAKNGNPQNFNYQRQASLVSDDRGSVAELFLQPLSSAKQSVDSYQAFNAQPMIPSDFVEFQQINDQGRRVSNQTVAQEKAGPEVLISAPSSENVLLELQRSKSNMHENSTTQLEKADAQQNDDLISIDDPQQHEEELLSVFDKDMKRTNTFGLGLNRAQTQNEQALGAHVAERESIRETSAFAEEVKIPHHGNQVVEVPSFLPQNTLLLDDKIVAVDQNSSPPVGREMIFSDEISDITSVKVDAKINDLASQNTQINKINDSDISMDFKSQGTVIQRLGTNGQVQRMDTFRSDADYSMSMHDESLVSEKPEEDNFQLRAPQHMRMDSKQRRNSQNIAPIMETPREEENEQIITELEAKVQDLTTENARLVKENEEAGAKIQLLTSAMAQKTEQLQVQLLDLMKKNTQLVNDAQTRLGESMNVTQELEKLKRQQNSIEMCFKCDGKKVNKRGKPCKECKGSGKMNEQYQRQIQESIKQSLEMIIPDAFKGLQSMIKNGEQAFQDKPAHEGVQCVYCKADPLMGVRYKCVRCEDFNICEECELTQCHSAIHAMVQIKFPYQAPQSDESEMKKKIELGQKLEAQRLLLEQNAKREEDRPIQQRPAPAMPAVSNNKISVEFVNENFGEKYVVQLGSTFTKVWTFKNTSANILQPGSIFLKFDSGHRFTGAAMASLAKPAAAGECFDMTCKFKTPQEIGSYCAGFRLVNKDAPKGFGSKVWCDVVVEDKLSESVALVNLMNPDFKAAPQPVAAKPSAHISNYHAPVPSAQQQVPMQSHLLPQAAQQVPMAAPGQPLHPQAPAQPLRNEVPGQPQAPHAPVQGQPQQVQQVQKPAQVEEKKNEPVPAWGMMPSTYNNPYGAQSQSAPQQNQEHKPISAWGQIPQTKPQQPQNAWGAQSQQFAYSLGQEQPKPQVQPSSKPQEQPQQAQPYANPYGQFNMPQQNPQQVQPQQVQQPQQPQQVQPQQQQQQVQPQQVQPQQQQPQQQSQQNAAFGAQSYGNKPPQWPSQMQHNPNQVPNQVPKQPVPNPQQQQQQQPQQPQYQEVPDSFFDQKPKIPKSSITDFQMEQVNYIIKVEALSISDKKYRPLLLQLGEMGYTNFNRNMALANKYDGQIDMILNELTNQPAPAGNQRQPQPQPQPQPAVYQLQPVVYQPQPAGNQPQAQQARPESNAVSGFRPLPNVNLPPVGAPQANYFPPYAQAGAQNAGNQGVPQGNYIRQDSMTVDQKKIDYVNKVEKMNQTDYKEVMLSLLAFGFFNFEVNKNLAAKHKGDINAILSDMPAN